MKPQNFSNHSRIVKGFHIVTFALILAVLILSVINFFYVLGQPYWIFTGIIPFLISIVLILIAFYARFFALKAQDRAIRAEENFRHFILTGKPLPSSLKLAQIIALRFAPDEELTALVQRAIKETLSSKEIKKSIVNWKADNDRA
ncbi:MAG TPA: DUF6526 family protein [Panacibacter sp.]|nr:DUF6526 family protein [Panacibacter sp.]